MLLSLGSRRQTLLILAALTLLLLITYHRNDLPDVPHLSTKAPPRPHERLSVRPSTPEQREKVHLLLPASSGDINLCKTLLTASVLGYPVPTLISWNESFTDEKLIGGGRHVAKIDKVREWLDAQPEENKDDLVMVVDAYGGFNYFSDRDGIDAHMDGDVWFQLPVEVLIERYYAINEKANADLETRMGTAYEVEGIRQSIVFGSSKRCTPSDVSSSACYPIPDSPLPSTLYGKFTEKPEFNHTTHRQRYLSSAYTIGPVADMRAMFRRASEKAVLAGNAEPPTTKAPVDPALELGSDQAIFHRMLGEQEFQREVLRRRHGERPRGRTNVEGAVIEDILDPAFPHEVLPPNDGRTDEFGMGIDYWSDLGIQTALNEDDTHWLIYKRPAAQQLLAKPRSRASCTPNVAGVLPAEVFNSTALPRAAVSDASQFSPLHGWDEIPLYTNLCLDTIPVIVNHNGDRTARERDWPELWLQPHGRRLIEEILDRGVAGGEDRGGAYVGVGGPYKGWGELCPASLERELYRDYYEPGM